MHDWIRIVFFNDFNSFLSTSDISNIKQIEIKLIQKLIY